MVLNQITVPRAPPTHGHIREDSLLGTLIARGDLSLVKWWTRDPSFTPDVLNTLTYGHHGQRLVDLHLDKAPWLRFWSDKGLSLHGQPGEPLSATPFFSANNADSLKVFFDAGFDPDQADEHGHRVDDCGHPDKKKNWPKVHAYAQEARFKLGHHAEADAANWRHQFTRLMVDDRTGSSGPWGDAFFSNDAFAHRFCKGPWPVWQEGPVPQGLMEVLARSGREAATKHLRAMMGHWKLTATGADNREGKEARKRHHDNTQDWVMAHVWTMGLPWPPDRMTAPKAQLLPPEIQPSDLTDLFQAWLREGPNLPHDVPWHEAAQRGTQGRLKDHWSALRPEHAAVAAQLVARGVNTPSGSKQDQRQYLGALSTLWPHVTDPTLQALMWGTLVLTTDWMETQGLNWGQAKPHAPRQAALANATPALWRTLPEHPLWTSEGPLRSDRDRIEAAVRQAQTDDLTTSHRRRRLRS